MYALSPSAPIWRASRRGRHADANHGAQGGTLTCASASRCRDLEEGAAHRVAVRDQHRGARSAARYDLPSCRRGTVGTQMVAGVNAPPAAALILLGPTVR